MVAGNFLSQALCGRRRHSDSKCSLTLGKKALSKGQTSESVQGKIRKIHHQSSQSQNGKTLRPGRMFCVKGFLSGENWDIHNLVLKDCQGFNAVLYSEEQSGNWCHWTRHRNGYVKGMWRKKVGIPGTSECFSTCLTLSWSLHHSCCCCGIVYTMDKSKMWSQCKVSRYLHF